MKNLNSENKLKFTTYRNKFKQLCIKVERNYYAAEFSRYTHNLKKTWSIIRSLLKAKDTGTNIECFNI